MGMVRIPGWSAVWCPYMHTVGLPVGLPVGPDADTLPYPALVGPAWLGDLLDALSVEQGRGTWPAPLSYRGRGQVGAAITALGLWWGAAGEPAVRACLDGGVALGGLSAALGLLAGHAPSLAGGARAPAGWRAVDIPPAIAWVLAKHALAGATAGGGIAVPRWLAEVYEGDPDGGLVGPTTVLAVAAVAKHGRAAVARVAGSPLRARRARLTELATAP